MQEYTNHKDCKVGEVVAGAVHNILAYCCLTSLSGPLWVTYHNIHNILHANITGCSSQKTACMSCKKEAENRKDPFAVAVVITPVVHWLCANEV